MQAPVVKDVLLGYLDHNFIFIVCIDVYDYLLDSFILQQNIQVAIYSCKLSITQENNTTIERYKLLVVAAFCIFAQFYWVQTFISILIIKILLETYFQLNMLCNDHFELKKFILPFITLNIWIMKSLIHFHVSLKSMTPSLQKKLIPNNIPCNNIETFCIECDNDTLAESFMHHPNFPYVTISPLQFFWHTGQFQGIKFLQQQLLFQTHNMITLYLGKMKNFS